MNSITNSRPGTRTVTVPMVTSDGARTLMRVSMILFGLFWVLGAQAAPVLQAVDIANLPGGQVQLRFQLSEPIAEPHSFSITNPPRIVLDFPGVKNGLHKNQQTINQGPAQQVTVLEGSDRTRAAINLSRSVPYTIRRQGDNILLTLGASGSARPGSRPARAAAPPVGRKVELGAIKFHRGAQGQGIIEVPLTNSSVTVDVRQQGDNIVADFLGAQLPRGQERRLDVTDFATPVTLIDAYNREAGARLVIKRNSNSDYLAYQTDDRYTIEVRPTLQEQAEQPEKKVYTGKPVSLNFQDIEVRAVLQILADFTGLNIVVSDSVQGNITLRLHNVPWDQALDIILRTKGLTMRRNGNVIYIAPTAEIAARDKIELEAQKQRVELEPLRTETIQVNYAKAEDLAKLIKSRSGKKNGEASLLSPRGDITADPRTNILLVQDIPSKIEEIRALIAKLDKPVRQVQIDARIVIANDSFNRELGVRWGISGVQQVGNAGLASISGSADANDAVVSSAVSNLQQTGQPFPTAIPALKNRLGVNLGVGSPTSSIAFALLGQDYLVDLELSALQAEGKGEILSNPRVITTDRKEAVITQGTQIPYATVSQNGTQTQLIDATLALKVTPQITPDGRIIMDLDVKKDEPGAQTTAGPEINKREIKTQVLVDDGETVVLGGVYEKTLNNSVDKVPLLGDIPILGHLFQHTNKTDQKLELLIFVTPKILQPGSAANP